MRSIVVPLLVCASLGCDASGPDDAGRDAARSDARRPPIPEPFPPADRAPTERTLTGIVGVSVHPSDMPVAQDAVSSARRAAGLSALAAAGVRRIRRDFLWREIEPEPGRFELADYDGLVDEAAALDIEVLALLVYGVGWANGDAPSGTPPDDPADYGRYAGAIAEHFRGRVRHYECWNEPNVLFRFWLGTSRDEPDRWADLCIAAHTEIHAVDPDAIVMPGGTTYVPQLITGGPLFVSEAYRMRPALGAATDALALHGYSPYPPSVSPESDQRDIDIPLVEKLRAFAGILAAIERPEVELWVTEIGWPTYERLDEQGQAQFTVRSVLLGALGGADTLFLFNLNDGPEPSDTIPEDNFGLIQHDLDPLDGTPGTPKMSYDALTTLLRTLGDYRVVEDLSSDGETYVLRLTDGTNTAHAVWTVAPMPIDVVIDVDTPMVDLVPMVGAPETRSATGGSVTVSATGSPVYVVAP